MKLTQLGSVWYMYLKTENCCLKIFVEIRVGEKMCENAWNVVWKLKMVVWKHKPNTPLIVDGQDWQYLYI